MKIKKGDNVIVISGKDKGKKAKVLRAFPKENKIVVEGVNVVTKHSRPRRAGEKGQIMHIAMPINVSNVMVVCSKCEKPTRVGYEVLPNKTKVRICKKCKSQLD
ncbi:MAG: 50S ribosomal protein L24 [Candidatus Nealsonbacteria bacterium]|nr:MAG: 50S ribosomal protein L24 [Candidatus Nealsonbacteria bacterium]